MPRGILATTPELPALPTHGPWTVKAQMPAGGAERPAARKGKNAADVLLALGLRKPVYALIAGRRAKRAATLWRGWEERPVMPSVVAMGGTC